MKMVAEGLVCQGEVCRKALGAPLKNAGAICSVIDQQRRLLADLAQDAIYLQRVPSTRPVLVLRFLGKSVGMRKVEDTVRKKEEERKVRGKARRGVRERRGKKTGDGERKEDRRERRRDRGEGAEIKNKRDGMGIWDGEAGRREGKGGSGKERFWKS